MSRFFRAVVALAAAALVTAAATASPAHASPTEYLHLSSGNDITLGLNGATKEVVFETWVDYGVAPKLILDASSLATIATVTPKDTTMCATAGTTITCSLPAGTSEQTRIKFTVHSKTGATVGATGGLAADLRDGAGVQDSQGGIRVTIGDGIDLVSYPVFEKDQSAKAGDTVWLPAIIGNEGNQTADHAAAVFSFAPGIAPDQYEGCTYATGDTGTSVSCPLPQLRPCLIWGCLC